MDLKLILPVFVLLRQVFVVDALVCYECASYKASGFDFGVDVTRDRACETGIGITNTSVVCSTCFKINMDIKLHYRDSEGGELKQSRVTQIARGCDDFTLFTTVNDTCKTIVELVTEDYGSYARFEEAYESVIESQFSEIHEVEITSFDGSLCYCKSDYCNTAKIATGSLTFMLKTTLFIIVLLF